MYLKSVHILKHIYMSDYMDVFTCLDIYEYGLKEN